MRDGEGSAKPRDEVGAVSGVELLRECAGEIPSENPGSSSRLVRSKSATSAPSLECIEHNARPDAGQDASDQIDSRAPAQSHWHPEGECREAYGSTGRA